MGVYTVNVKAGAAKILSQTRWTTVRVSKRTLCTYRTKIISPRKNNVFEGCG